MYSLFFIKYSFYKSPTLLKYILSFSARGNVANTDLVLFVCPKIQTDRKSIFLSFKCRVPGHVICRITTTKSSCRRAEAYRTNLPFCVPLYFIFFKMFQSMKVLPDRYLMQQCNLKLFAAWRWDFRCKNGKGSNFATKDATN